MNEVKVKREELLTKVRANRDAHRSLFLLAQEGYRKLVIEELDKMLADARAGLPIKRSVSLTEPSDHTKDYDRVVAMLDERGRDDHTRGSGFRSIRHGQLGLVEVRALDKYILRS